MKSTRSRGVSTWSCNLAAATAPRYRSAPRPWAGRRDAADRCFGAACIPASLSQEVGLALGAQVGESRIRDLVTNVGLSRSAGSARHHSTSCSRPGHSRSTPTSATIRPGPEPPDQLGPEAPARGGEGLGWRYLPVDASRAGIPTVAPTPTSPRELQSGHRTRSRRMEGHQ